MALRHHKDSKEQELKTAGEDFNATKEKEVQGKKDLAALIASLEKAKASLAESEAKFAQGDEPCKSFKQDKLSDMLERLWVQGLGVPREAVAHYARRGVKGGRHLRKEAWFRGVADPTGGIPPGYAFASGLPMDSAPLVGNERCVFVTRSPCVKAEHGR